MSNKVLISVFASAVTVAAVKGAFHLRDHLRETQERMIAEAAKRALANLPPEYIKSAMEGQDDRTRKAN